MKNRNRKKTIFLSLLACAILFLYWLFYIPSYRYGSTSADKKYTIEVYENPKPFITTPGDGSSRTCKLILKNEQGHSISSSDDILLNYCNKEQATFEWDLRSGYVWYICDDHIIGGFDLKTKKFEY